MNISIQQIADILDARTEGPADEVIHSISGLEHASAGSISFLSNLKYEQFLYSTQASAVIVQDQFRPKKTRHPTLLKVKDPYLSFAALLEEFNKIEPLQMCGVEQPSFISKGVEYGEGLYLGAFAYLGKGVRLGEHVKIFPQAYIGEGSMIGNGTIIHSGVRIYPGTVIGNHCVIHSGTVIGSDGFGFAPEKNGSYKKIPQVGKVILEDHVEVGANTTIDKATIDATIIRTGVKIDNLVQIAHNVEIGENTVIASQTGISGSSKIGKQVVIAGQAGVVGHVHVGDHVTLAGRAAVSKDVPSGKTMLGAPAFERTNFLRSYTIFQRLPDVLRRIEELEEKILNLSSGKNSR